MSITRRGKYTDSNICTNVQVQGRCVPTFLAICKLTDFSYPVRGKSLSFYRGKVTFLFLIIQLKLLFFDFSLHFSLLPFLFSPFFPKMTSSCGEKLEKGFLSLYLCSALTKVEASIFVCYKCNWRSKNGFTLHLCDISR